MIVTDYMKFQAKLYPVLPFLIYQAFQIKKQKPSPPSISENLVLGNGNRKILILGESTAAGVGASSIESTMAGHFFNQLGNEFHLTNLGKNGLRVSEVLAQFRESLNEVQGKLEGVFLFLGANDCFRLTNPKEYRTELVVLIQFLKSKFSTEWIYLADIPPVQLFPAFPKLLKYYLNQQRSFLQKEMKLVSESHKDILFDPINLEINSDFFASDRIHPSNIGYQKIAEFAIEGLLKNGLLKLK